MKDIEAVLGPFRAISCEWHTGGRRGVFYNECGKDVLPKKTYCAEHMAQAYQKPKRKKRARR